MREGREARETGRRREGGEGGRRREGGEGERRGREEREGGKGREEREGGEGREEREGEGREEIEEEKRERERENHVHSSSNLTHTPVQSHPPGRGRGSSLIHTGHHQEGGISMAHVHGLFALCHLQLHGRELLGGALEHAAQLGRQPLLLPREVVEEER